MQKQHATIAKETRGIENDRKIIENIAKGGRRERDGVIKAKRKSSVKFLRERF